MQETRSLGWKGRLLLAALVIVLYFAMGLLAQMWPPIRSTKLPTVALLGYLWALRGYWLTWKDMLIIALLSMVPVNALVIPTIMDKVNNATPATLGAIFLLGIFLEGLLVMAGLWVGRFVAVLSGKLQKPGTGGG